VPRGINTENANQLFMTVILQSTAQPSTAYELRYQYKTNNVTTANEVTALGSATLVAGNFYRLTAKGRKQLSVETGKWDRMAAAIARILRNSTVRSS